MRRASPHLVPLGDEPPDRTPDRRVSGGPAAAPGSWTLAERWLGRLYVTAGVLGIVNIVVPGYPGFDIAGLAALSAAAFAAAAVLLRARGRLPTAVLHGFLAAGSAAIGAAIHFTEGVPNAGSMLYLWVALYAFYFFGWTAAAVHVGLIGASYGIAIALQPPPFPPFAHWATTVFTMAIAGVFVGVLKSRLDHTLARLERLAASDPLTGLANRRGWWERAAVEIARADRSDSPLAVAVLDLDGFKAFNDRYGHAAGDRSLRQCAERWTRAVRPTDFLARLGGDEFAVLLPACDALDAEHVVRRLAAVVPPGLSCSYGLAVWQAGEPIEQTLERADVDLYASKRSADREAAVGAANG